MPKSNFNKRLGVFADLYRGIKLDETFRAAGKDEFRYVKRGNVSPSVEIFDQKSWLSVRAVKQAEPKREMTAAEQRRAAAEERRADAIELLKISNG